MERVYPIFPGNDSNRGLVGVPVSDSDDNNLKMSNDTFEVFVNDDKVGNKELLTQTDDAEDLNGYLKDNGFNNFKVNVLGNSIVIETNERPQKMKEMLSSYLDIR